jgi:hypothetical protein
MQYCGEDPLEEATTASSLARRESDMCDGREKEMLGVQSVA